MRSDAVKVRFADKAVTGKGAPSGALFGVLHSVRLSSGKAAGRQGASRFAPHTLMGGDNAVRLTVCGAVGGAAAKRNAADAGTAAKYYLSFIQRNCAKGRKKVIFTLKTLYF